MMAVSLLAGCPGDVRPLGDENMGTYVFQAQPQVVACQLSINADPFTFSGTMSRYRDGGHAFLLLQGINRDAGFDGQVFVSAHTAASALEECKPCTTQVQETITVALLSKSQSDALGGKCPANPLDGGVPAPNDAGINGPGSTDKGFDSVRACGEMSDVIIATAAQGETCPEKCTACSFRYQLTGERQ